ncbi:MAG: dUTP diphosphatase [Flavobacteriaceae bacterium]|jgi:dUTP pyrophosphatase|nr:dUTP diphosphatase [Flavobacteriaceae bacterium]
MKIRIINRSGHSLPKYETDNSAGMDIKAFINKDIILRPLERAIVTTGLYLSLPNGYEAQVRPRSGLAIKKGISVLNSPGTIDSDYRGEIGVILINLSNEEFKVKNGDRIAQLIIAKHESISWEEAEQLEDSPRGSAGFGSTGL